LTFDPETYEVKTLTESKASSFADVMEKKQPAVLLPEIMTMADRGRKNHDNSAAKAGRSGAKTPDAAKERVAAVFNFRNKPGYNPTPADQASVMTDTSHSTNGAASDRSVTTDNIQCQLPELRLLLNHLRERLCLLSPEDPLFNENVTVDSTFEDISLSSNASLILNAIYKDTKTCIKLLLVCISELEHSSPRRQVEAPGLPPLLRLVVLRHREDKLEGPALCFGYEQREWGAMYPPQLVVE
jgi:hypothetical protein